MYIHDYFKQKYTKWCILGFLNECDEEPFKRKIDLYIKSLITIIDEVEGKRRRREKAQLLFNRYKKACDETFVIFI